MRILSIFSLLIFLSVQSITAQDFLSVPSANPQLFPKGMNLGTQKLLYQVDSIVYEYDTLSLPFVDDFSKDHFPTLIKDPANDSRVTTAKYYTILQNGQVYQGAGFVTFKTVKYTISASGDTVATDTNSPQIIQVFDIQKYPPTFTLETVYPPYTITDKDSVGIDTTFLTPLVVQDSITYYVADKDSTSFYLDRSAYHNYTMGFYPPTIGVATFDGLNQFGLPYNFDDITTNGNADYLTSVPINLAGTSDSTYFSFYYQAKGFALEGPEQEDSLSLEFYNTTTKRWGLVWQKQGLGPTAAADSFRQVILRVNPIFRSSGFQFRFRNKAKLTGAFDNWHIDYIYLDDNRRLTDTSQKDLSFVYKATSLLKQYEAMPVWHFKTDPSLYMADTVRLVVRNNHDGPLNVFNKIVIPDTNAMPASNFYIFPGASQFRQIPAFGNLNLNYPISFSYPSSAVDTIGVFKGGCDISFRPAPIETKDFILGNDTTFSRATLSNYYAYDDGSAEAGYGINAGSQGANKTFLAVRFDMPFQDTLGGVKMYFLPQQNDIRNQNFKLTVWSSLSPQGIIFQKEVSSKAIYGEMDGYITYFFDSLILVGPTFYVGFEKIGAISMNIGYDLNKNHRDKYAWSLNGINWNSPSNNILDGSIMLRPILRKKNFGVGVTERQVKKNASQLIVYPNPVSTSFQLAERRTNLVELQLFSFDGKLVKQYHADQDVYMIDDLPNGIYILQALDRAGRRSSSKIMISR